MILDFRNLRGKKISFHCLSLKDIHDPNMQVGGCYAATLW